MYFNKESVPITMNEWGRLFSNADYQRIGYDIVRNIRISTVWIGLDMIHNPPKLFETCIFDDKGGSRVLARYHTEQEAKESHEYIVNCIKTMNLDQIFKDSKLISADNDK